MNQSIYLFISVLVMALTTYLIRMLPLVVFRRRIKSRFLRSMLYYMPYSVLGAMTVPWIFYSTGSFVTAAVGFAAALVFSVRGRSLITVALAAVAAALITGFFVG